LKLEESQLRLMPRLQVGFWFWFCHGHIAAER